MCKILTPTREPTHFLHEIRVSCPITLSRVCVCVYSSSRNDVTRVAQRYGTIAAHTRRRASVLVVFVLFSEHMHSFAGLIRRTPPPTFSDTAITDRHSDTTIFQLRAYWVRISWSVGSEKSFGHVPRWKSNPRLPACKASTLSTRPGSPLNPVAVNGRQFICRIRVIVLSNLISINVSNFSGCSIIRTYPKPPTPNSPVSPAVRTHGNNRLFVKSVI